MTTTTEAQNQQKENTHPRAARRPQGVQPAHGAVPPGNWSRTATGMSDRLRNRKTSRRRRLSGRTGRWRPSRAAPTPRAWLYKIAHNLSINHVQRRPSWDSLADSEEAGRVETSIAAEAAGQGREDVRLGFVALMQSLPARQRAALVLRDVLGWSAEEAAQILGTTVPAVKNALARARQTLASLPHGDDPANVSDLAARDPEAREVVAQWADAFEKGKHGPYGGASDGAAGHSRFERECEGSQSGAHRCPRRAAG